MSDEHYKNGNSIILNEKDTIVNDLSQVADIFNEFFMTVASGIGFDDTIISAADAIRKHKEHSSVGQIRHEFGEINGEFYFKPATVDLVMQNIENVNPKKATRYDNIPGKMIKSSHLSDAVKLASYSYCSVIVAWSIESRKTIKWS